MDQMDEIELAEFLENVSEVVDTAMEAREFLESPVGKTLGGIETKLEQIDTSVEFADDPQVVADIHEFVREAHMLLYDLTNLLNK
jgi:hypothetical protein